MTRHIQERSSTVAMKANGRMTRLALAAISMLTAFALVLGMAGVSAAWAQDGLAAGTLQGVGNLMSGQLANAKSATVLVYLNGSDLESDAGEASADITEMLDSGIGANVNVVIETLGTREWQDHGIASDHTQRYLVNQGKLELVDDSLGQLDTTAPETLSDFISWGVQNYPADRYILLLWDHGAGPVYGFGYDEFQDDYAALTLDEMKQALEENSSVHFDIIGMDCCIMSSLETCYVLQPFCDYTILSEDFEPGIGWSYERWMRMLDENPGIGSEELGKAIVDDMIADVAADRENGDATLALIDESAIDELYGAWMDFAYASKDELLGNNYSQEIQWRDRPSAHDGVRRPHNQDPFGGYGREYSGPQGSYGWEDAYGWEEAYGWEDAYGWDEPFGADDGSYGFGYGYGYGYEYDYDDAYGYGYGYDDAYGYGPGNGYDGGHAGSSYGYPGASSHGEWEHLWDSWDYDTSYVTMTDYFVTDILEVASSIDSAEAAALETATNNAIVHYKATSGEEGMSGLGVTLPYGDAEFYDELVKVFKACGIDGDYVDWLESFVAVGGVGAR